MECKGLIYKCSISSYANKRGEYEYKERMRLQKKKSCSCDTCESNKITLSDCIGEGDAIEKRPTAIDGRLYRLVLEGSTEEDWSVRFELLEEETTLKQNRSCHACLGSMSCPICNSLVCTDDDCEIVKDLAVESAGNCSFFRDDSGI